MGSLYFDTGIIIFRRKTTFYRITKTEALRKSIFGGRTNKKSIPLEGISGIEVRRGIVHRIIGIGHLQFCSRLSGQPDLWWFGVENPFAVKKKDRTNPKKLMGWTCLWSS